MMCVYMYVCMYIYVLYKYVYLYIYTLIIYIYIYIYIWVYIYIYVCNIYMSICMSINGYKLNISVYISSDNCVSNKNQSKKSF